MIDIHKLLSPPYLLESRPDYNWHYLPIGFGFGVISLGLGLGLWGAQHNRSVASERALAHWFISLGLCLLTLVAARYEALPYLSMRIFWYLLTFSFGLWLGLIRYYNRQRAVQPENEARRYESFERYLPRPKNSREPLKTRKGRR